MKHATCLILAAALIAAGLASNAAADTVRLAGAPSVIALVINPNRAAVERATGYTLEVVASGTGQGLVDLADRKADVAMVSERIDMAVADAAKAGRKIHPSALWVHELRKDEIVFLVHASNPVSKLTLAQLSDINTGRITNWKQVGGKDRPITVYSGAVTEGTSALVRKVVMRGADYAGGVRTALALTPVSDLVQGDESAIAAVGKTLVRPGAAVKVIETTRMTRQLSLMTVGAPSPKVAQVIDALKRAAAGQLTHETVLVAQ
jgi:phosphate transport system substrate-binding protein